MSVPLRVYVVLLPLWLPLAAGTAVAAAGSGIPWAGVAVLLALGYPVALAVTAVASRRSRDPRAARRWTLLPLPWVLAGAALLAVALST